MQRIPISEQDCEALFISQASHWQGQPIGAHGVLPACGGMVEPPTDSPVGGADQPLWVQRQHTDEDFTGLLFVDPALPHFAGHFPDNPLLAGVIQINWAVATASQTFESTPATAFAGMSRIKFKAPIKPGAWLKLQMTQRHDQVIFSYANHDGVCTEGRLQFNA